MTPRRVAADPIRKGGMWVTACLLANVAFASMCGAQAAGIKVDSTWLRVLVPSTTAEVTLIAGFQGINGGLNFNGGTRGALTIVVPVHWHVVLHFRNDDQNFAHSAEVIPATDPVPNQSVTHAFQGASSGGLSEGLAPGSHQDIKFVAERAGKFLVFCAVPGHGLAGMWIRFEVSATASRPAISATSGGS